MAIYRYIVTVELTPNSQLTSADIEKEIDVDLEYGIVHHDIEHFTVEPLSAEYYQNANRPTDYPVHATYEDYREHVIRSHES